MYSDYWKVLFETTFLYTNKTDTGDLKKQLHEIIFYYLLFTLERKNNIGGCLVFNFWGKNKKFLLNIL